MLRWPIIFTRVIYQIYGAKDSITNNNNALYGHENKKGIPNC